MVAVGAWQNKVRNAVRKKLLRMKQVHSGLTLKLSPVPLDVFKGLYNLLATLQPADGGCHLSPLQHVAGSRGGEDQEHCFEIVSDRLAALFFKPTFVFAYMQGSLLLREEDGKALAVLAPITFGLKYTMPEHLTDFVLTITYHAASLPRDGKCPFDEKSVEYSAAPKEQMRSDVCGELRKMFKNSFMPLTESASTSTS
eukprot:6210114-Pleurochrysis_carterae.AAC.1